MFEPEKPNPFAAVYPNPGNDMITVTGVGSGNFTFRMYDLTGKLILDQENQQSISTELLPPGIYLYQVFSDSKSVTSGKWVKSR